MIWKGMFVFIVFLMYAAYNFFAAKEASEAGLTNVWVVYRAIFAAPVDYVKMIAGKIKGV